MRTRARRKLSQATALGAENLASEILCSHRIASHVKFVLTDMGLAGEQEEINSLLSDFCRKEN